MTPEEVIDQCFDALKARTEPPYDYAAGGPRNEDIIFSHSLRIPDVDGGAVDPMEKLQEAITPQFLSLLEEREVEYIHIATAFVVISKDEQQDSYQYSVTFSVYI